MNKADEVIVVCPNNYIGTSTSSEIKFDENLRQKMKEYNFTLKFHVPNNSHDYAEFIYKHCKSDVLVGIGNNYTISVMFCSEAKNASQAIHHAINDLTDIISFNTVDIIPDLN